MKNEEQARKDSSLPDTANQQVTSLSAPLPVTKLKFLPKWQRVPWIRRIIEPLFASQNTPGFDARGVAVGLFVGLAVPVGAQILVLALSRLIVRFNSMVAFAVSWVNNPLSLIPMYYGFYWLGSVCLGRPHVLTFTEFRGLIGPALSIGYFWESLRILLNLGWDIVVRWAIGAHLVAGPCAVLGYVLCYRAQKARCMRKAQEMGIAYRSLIEKLERSSK